MMYLVSCWAVSSSHLFHKMSAQGPIFIAEVTVSFAQYLQPSEVQIKEKKVIRTQQDSIFSAWISIWQQQSVGKMQIWFFPQTEMRGCWELSCCLIILKPFLQKVNWWDSAWNVLDAFAGKEVRWVNLRQLGITSAQTFMFIHLNTRARFFLARLWIQPVYFLFSDPLHHGKKNQRGFSAFPYPSLFCLVMLMSDNASWFFSQASAAENCFGGLGLFFTGYIKSFLQSRGIKTKDMLWVEIL